MTDDDLQFWKAESEEELVRLLKHLTSMGKLWNGSNEFWVDGFDRSEQRNWRSMMANLRNHGEVSIKLHLDANYAEYCHPGYYATERRYRNMKIKWNRVGGTCSGVNTLAARWFKKPEQVVESFSAARE